MTMLHDDDDRPTNRVNLHDSLTHPTPVDDDLDELPASHLGTIASINDHVPPHCRRHHAVSLLVALQNDDRFIVVPPSDFMACPEALVGLQPRGKRSFKFLNLALDTNCWNSSTGSITSNHAMNTHVQFFCQRHLSCLTWLWAHHASTANKVNLEWFLIFFKRKGEMVFEI